MRFANPFMTRVETDTTSTQQALDQPIEPVRFGQLRHQSLGFAHRFGRCTETSPKSDPIPGQHDMVADRVDPSRDTRGTDA